MKDLEVTESAREILHRAYTKLGHFLVRNLYFCGFQCRQGSWGQLPIFQRAEVSHVNTGGVGTGMEDLFHLGVVMRMGDPHTFTEQEESSTGSEGPGPEGELAVSLRSRSPRGALRLLLGSSASHSHLGPAGRDLTFLFSPPPQCRRGAQANQVATSKTALKAASKHADDIKLSLWLGTDFPVSLVSKCGSCGLLPLLKVTELNISCGNGEEGIWDSERGRENF